MNLFLDFEQPIAELQAQIDELRHVSEHNRGSSAKISPAGEEKRRADQEDLQAIWGPGRSQMARHPLAPYTQDYIDRLFTDFDELAGDRAYADDKAIVGGSPVSTASP